MQKKSRPYLPKMRTEYHPTQEECNDYTEIGHPENMPNPANDPIVVNNIACQEFDYTEKMLDDSLESHSISSKNIKN